MKTLQSEICENNNIIHYCQGRPRILSATKNKGAKKRPCARSQRTGVAALLRHSAAPDVKQKAWLDHFALVGAAAAGISSSMKSKHPVSRVRSAWMMQSSS